MRRIVGPAVLLFLLTAAAPFPFPRTRTVRPRNPAVSLITGWPKFGGTLAMSGMPTGPSSLTSATVPRLALSWKTPLSGPVASAPSVLSDTLYVGDWGGFENALDVLRHVAPRIGLAREAGRGGKLHADVRIFPDRGSLADRLCDRPIFHHGGGHGHMVEDQREPRIALGGVPRYMMLSAASCG